MINNNIKYLHTIFGGLKQSDVMSGSAHMHIFIHPAGLCILVGACNTFPFKVIINMYDAINVFLVFWVYFL